MDGKEDKKNTLRWYEHREDDNSVDGQRWWISSGIKNEEDSDRRGWQNRELQREALSATCSRLISDQVRYTVIHCELNK